MANFDTGQMRPIQEIMPLYYYNTKMKRKRYKQARGRVGALDAVVRCPTTPPLWTMPAQSSYTEVNYT